MLVKDIMTRNVNMSQADETLVETARAMKSFEIGVLPVVQDNTIVGMVTDRDIVVRGIAAGMDPATAKIGTVVTPQVQQCAEDATVEEAAQLMETHQVQRLLVVDQNNKAVGILSLSDLAKTSQPKITAEVVEKVKTGP